MTDFVVVDTSLAMKWVLMNMGTEITESPKIHIRALELARELGLPVAYDTHYLALAEILDCDLWTADERFFNAVKAQQPKVKWLGDFGLK